jgi:hypothetical protein
MNEPDFTEIDDAEVTEPSSKKTKLVETGNKGTILDISELIDKYKIEQPRQFAKGGVAMNEQMEMAFMQEGGLKDDGMNQDPVSGNEVPPGSMAKEVRDDISAQLSEGEYVVPADVVRFFGVKFFEDLRTEAKIGLQSMEANGRIGGEPVPMETDELSNEEFARLLQQELGGNIVMAEGGMVPEVNQEMGTPAPIQAAEGTYVPGQMPTFNPRAFGLGFSMTPGYTPPPVAGTEPTVETEASCAARGLVLGPDGMCMVPPTPQVRSRDDDGPATPTPTAGEGGSLGGAWYEGDEEELLNDPEAYIKDQLARGQMLDSGIAKAAAYSLPGGLGLILGGANTFADTEGIARARAALMIAEARGSLNQDKIKELQNLIDKDVKGNFIVDQDGKGLGFGTGVNYANSFAKLLGFDTLEEASSKQNKENFNSMANLIASGSRIDFSRTDSEAWTRKSKEERQAAIDKANEDAKKKQKAAAAAQPSSGAGRDDDYSAADMMRDRLDKKSEGGKFSGSVTSGAVYAGGNRAEGGLMLKKKKPKKKK